MRTVADVIECYKEVVRLISDGYSRNQALKASKKQLTSFNRVKHIYPLYVTRPERLVQVSQHGMISGTLHLISHESCLSTFRYNQNGIRRAWLRLTKCASSTLSRHSWARCNNRENCQNMVEKLLVVSGVNGVDFYFQFIIFHKAQFFHSDSIVISVIVLLSVKKVQFYFQVVILCLVL